MQEAPFTETELRHGDLIALLERARIEAERESHSPEVLRTLLRRALELV